jgi:hypothetical protein
MNVEKFAGFAGDRTEFRAPERTPSSPRTVGGRWPTGAARVTEMRDFFRFVGKENEGMIDRWHASRRGDG